MTSLLLLLLLLHVLSLAAILCSPEGPKLAAVVAAQPMELGAMSEVDLFDDHEVVVRMMQEFEALDQGVRAQDFISGDA